MLKVFCMWRDLADQTNVKAQIFNIARGNNAQSLWKFAVIKWKSGPADLY